MAVFQQLCLEQNLHTLDGDSAGVYKARVTPFLMEGRVSFILIGGCNGSGILHVLGPPLSTDCLTQVRWELLVFAGQSGRDGLKHKQELNMWGPSTPISGARITSYCRSLTNSLWLNFPPFWEENQRGRQLLSVLCPFLPQTPPLRLLPL